MKIVFVGLGGIPYSSRAIDVRLGSFAELFVNCGYEVEIINRYSPNKVNVQTPYTINEAFPKMAPKSKMARLVLYALALICEPFRIFNSNRKKKIDVLFMSTGHFVDIVIYRLISWIIGTKLVDQYCEARSSFETKGIYARINGFLVDKISPKLWDGSVCISHYLQESCVKVNKNLPTSIVYPLCDFTLFDGCDYTNNSDYILFCGSIGYRETIDFILESYRKSKMHETVKLLMILAGSKSNLEAFKRENEDVAVESNLPYADLIKRYKGARALLIPLRNITRDIARFPNKTCEYCASKGVIVTTNVGEMPYVFKDGLNAVVADCYDSDEYAEKLDWIFDNTDKTESIRAHCYETGLKHFSLEAYQGAMSDFFNILTKR